MQDFGSGKDPEQDPLSRMNPDIMGERNPGMVARIFPRPVIVAGDEGIRSTGFEAKEVWAIPANQMDKSSVGRMDMGILDGRKCPSRSRQNDENPHPRDTPKVLRECVE